jgi:hypothetical protein
MAERARRESSHLVCSAWLRVVAHPVGGVGVEAAHAGDLVAEALFGEDLGDAVFGHPGLVAVPDAVRGQGWLDGKPAG